MNSKLLLASSTFLLISIILSVNLSRFLSDHLSGEDKSISNYDDFEDTQVIPIVGAVGPESFAFDPVTGDGPYVGVSDGRIIKWNQYERRWINFAVTSPERDGCEGSHDHDAKEYKCGRPLGLRFNERTQDLYIADAYMGLLVVGPNGGLATKVATQSHNIPFNFTNALDIDQSTGVVYFTDSNSIYQRRNHVSVVISGDKTGRLLKYDPNSKETSVILSNLSFPNGVALSKNGDFVLVAETTNCRILKVWLEPSARRIEEFAQVPGFPDNIKMNHKGELWVAIYSRRSTTLKWLLSCSWIRIALVKLLPFNITKLFSYLSDLKGGYGLAVRLSEEGEILEMLEDKFGNKWRFASEVQERNGYLWIGSVKMPFVVKHKITTTTTTT